MRILVSLFLLGLSSPALADDAACRTAPTRTCVFDMALAAASDEQDLQRVVTDLLTIAALQESAGDAAASSATAAQLIALIEDREPDATKADALLNWSAMAVSELIADAPLLATRMAQHSFGDDSALMTRLRFAALVGDLDGVNTMLDAAPGSAKDDLVLNAASMLMARGDYVAAYDIGERSSTPALRVMLDETAVTLLLRTDSLEAAEVVAAGMPDPAARAGAIVKVATALARHGEIAKAKAYADHAGELAGGKLSTYATLSRAAILVLAGDSAGAEALITSIKPDDMPPRGLESIALLGAIMAGDKAEVATLLGGFDQPNRAALAVKQAALACLEAGVCEASQVLAMVEGSAKAGVLNALGLLQARAGDSAAALGTLKDLRALGAETRANGDFRTALVLLLAREGNARLALDLAVEGGDARILAELANLL